MSAVDVMYHPYSNNLYCYSRSAIDQPKFHDMVDRAYYPNTEVLIGSPSTASPPVTTPSPHHLHPHIPQHQQQITPLPPTQHHSQHQQASSISTSHQPTSTQHTSQTHQPVTDMVTSPASSSRSNNTGVLSRSIIKEEDEGCEDGLVRPVATHILSNDSCLRIFVHSDFKQCVDEHFRKSLSQQHSTYRATGSPQSAGGSPDGSKITHYSKESRPMTQRQFPASFWDPHTTSTLHSSYLDSNHLPFNPSNPYFGSATIHSISSLHQVPPPPTWHYQLSPHSQGSYHRPNPPPHMHYEFGHPSMAAASSRFGSAHGQYNSLIVPHHPATATQPAIAAAMRSASVPFNSMAGQHCDISGKSAADLPTTARRIVEYQSHANMDPVLTGMEGHMQDTGKDSYWY